MSGLTRRSATAQIRPDIDRAAVRYFVYCLRDASGRPVYIGRSCNVAARLRGHYSNATHRHAPTRLRTQWLFDVRSVFMVGPFTWDGAVAEERRQIELEQPRGNIGLTARDHRPLVAARSAKAAKA